MEKRLTMEVATNNRLPFIGMKIINTGQHLETCVFTWKKKNTNTQRSSLALSKSRGQQIQTIALKNYT